MHTPKAVTKILSMDTRSGAFPRLLPELVFRTTSILGLSLALFVLVFLIISIYIDSGDRLSWQFLNSFPSRFAEKAGVKAALVGSFYMIILTALFALPLGIGAAVYLEEYASKNRFTRLIELNIANLAGVPSIIYGLLGLQIFVRSAGFGRSLLSGSLTLTLLILPIIIIASREALRTVPSSIKDASLALGATKWQTIYRQVLPIAFPGILTGNILALSRALGETAPLVTMGAFTYVAFVPDGLFSEFTVLPIQAFSWTSRPQVSFHQNAAAASIVLLTLMVTINLTAILLRNRFQRKAYQ